MPTFSLHRPTPLSTSEIASLPGGAVPVRGEGDVVARARFRALDAGAAVRLAFALGQAAPGARLEIDGLGAVDPSPTDAGALPDAAVSEETPEQGGPADGAPPESADDGPVDGGGTAADTLWSEPADETQEEPLPGDDIELELPVAETTDEVPLPEAAHVEHPAGPPPPMPRVDQDAPPAGAALVPVSAVGDEGPLPADAWEAWDAGDGAGALRALRARGLDSDGRARVRALMQSTDPAEVAQGCELACAAQWRSSVQAMRRLLQHADTRVRQAAVTAIGELAGPALVPSVRMLLRDASPAVRGAAVAALMKLESE